MIRIFVYRSAVAPSALRMPLLGLLVATLTVIAVGRVGAQDAADNVDVASPGAHEQELALVEGRLADRYQRLEQVMLRLSELSATSDPRRAAVLRRVVQQSKEQDVAILFESIVKLLEEDRLGTAAKNQQTLKTELHVLLDLLLKENRADRLESDEKRIRRYLKEVNRLIRLQKGVKARTEGGDDTERLANAQGKIGDKTGEIADEIDKNNADAKSGGGEGDSQDSSPGEMGDGDRDKDESGNKEDKKKGDAESERGDGDASKPTDPKDGAQGQGKEGQGKEGQGKEGQGKEGQGKEGQGKEGQGKKGQGQEDEQSPQDEQRALDKLRDAQQRMEEAKRKLEQAQREGAAEDQQKALEALQQARADLEEILRQLREEQHERLLAMLEARFRKMLQVQIEVYENTQQLDQIPIDRRDHDEEIAAGRMSRKERQLAIEADKAMRLLQEDGTSVAFPEAIEQMREDMQQVADRLTLVQVGITTQGIEEDIIAALEEMIAALEKEQKDREAKKGRPQQGNPGEPGDPALVDQLAELKMIRSLQMRVNRRTERYAQMLEGPPVALPELLKALRRLADRERRIFEATRDLQLGTNR